MPWEEPFQPAVLNARSMPSTRRRELLAIGCSAFIALSGCSSFDGSDTLHQTDVQNASRQPRDIRITVTDAEGRMLCEETFALNARDEDTDPFSGIHDRITVAFDGTAIVETAWPTQATEVRNGSEVHHVEDGCGATSSETVTGMFVYVNSPDFVVFRPTCGTPQ